MNCVSENVAAFCVVVGKKMLVGDFFIIIFICLILWAWSIGEGNWNCVAR
jgi:hypothetical protein